MREPLWTDIDLDAYEAIPKLEDLSWEKVEPFEKQTYWELRAGAFEGYQVIASVGRECAEADDHSYFQVQRHW